MLSRSSWFIIFYSIINFRSINLHNIHEKKTNRFNSRFCKKQYLCRGTLSYKYVGIIAYYEGSRSVHSYVHSNWVTFQMLDLNIKFLRKYVNLIVCNKWENIHLGFIWKMLPRNWQCIAAQTWLATIWIHSNHVIFKWYNLVQLLTLYYCD